MKERLSHHINNNGLCTSTYKTSNHMDRGDEMASEELKEETNKDDDEKKVTKFNPLNDLKTSLIKSFNSRVTDQIANYIIDVIKTKSLLIMNFSYGDLSNVTHNLKNDGYDISGKWGGMFDDFVIFYYKKTPVFIHYNNTNSAIFYTIPTKNGKEFFKLLDKKYRYNDSTIELNEVTKIKFIVKDTHEYMMSMMGTEKDIYANKDVSRVKPRNTIIDYPKSFNTIFIPQEQKDRIQSYVNQFREDKVFYREREIPHVMGIMFKGIPGNGKSAISEAIANMTNMPICIVNFTHDLEIIEECYAFIDSPSIILIEEIDTLFGDRAKGDEETEKFKFLLQVMSGVERKEDCITIATTNHWEKLDKALQRRFELVEDILPPTQELVNEYLSFFYRKEISINYTKNLSFVDILNICIANKYNSSEAIKLLT